VNKTPTGKYVNSKKYGSCIQLYYHTDKDDITYLACFKDKTKLGKDGRPIRNRIKIGLKSEGITEQYAKAKLDEIITKQRLGEVPEPIKRKRKKEVTTLQNLADIYFEYRSLSTHNSHNVEKNINNDKSIFKNHLSNLANDDVTLISRDIIEKLKQQKLKELSPKTVNNILTLLTSILNHAVSVDKLQTKPIVSKISGIDNARERYFNYDEILSILDKVKTDKALHLFVLTSLSTGGRLESIRAIMVKDINLKAKTINLVDYKAKSSGKGKISYTGYISDVLYKPLSEAIKGKSPNNYLFEHSNGSRIGMDYIQGKLQTIFNELFNQGLESNDSKNRAVVHTLRHTFASLLAIAGTPIFTIQRLMNHADIKMTLRYAKLSPDNGRDAVNSIFERNENE
jgi:integrase